MVPLAFAVNSSGLSSDVSVLTKHTPTHPTRSVDPQSTCKTPYECWNLSHGENGRVHRCVKQHYHLKRLRVPLKMAGLPQHI